MPAETDTPQFRHKTYSRRESRITKAQQRALNELSPRYVLEELESLKQLNKLFPNCDRFAIEIGFGDGDSLVRLASENPSTGFIGVEVYRPGVGRCLLSLDRENIDDVRVCTFDARDVLTELSTEARLSEIFVLFPDPWPKRRHHKRRLVSADFVSVCARCLRSGGRFHFASDSQDYASQVLELLQADEDFRNGSDDGGFYSGERMRPITRYERKALERGDQIYDLVFYRY